MVYLLLVCECNPQSERNPQIIFGKQNIPSRAAHQKAIVSAHSQFQVKRETDAPDFLCSGFPCPDFLCSGLDVDDRAGENLEFENIGTIHTKGNAGWAGMLPRALRARLHPRKGSRSAVGDILTGTAVGQVAVMHRTTGEDCG